MTSMLILWMDHQDIFLSQRILSADRLQGKDDGHIALFHFQNCSTTLQHHNQTNKDKTPPNKACDK